MSAHMQLLLLSDCTVDPRVTAICLASEPQVASAVTDSSLQSGVLLPERNTDVTGRPDKPARAVSNASMLVPVF
jgi:hypothetical protein